MAHTDTTTPSGTTPGGTTPNGTTPSGTTPSGTHSKVTKSDLLRAWGLRRTRGGKLVYAIKEDKTELKDDEWLSALEGAIKGAAKRMSEAAQARGFQGSVDRDDCEAQLRLALINQRHWAAGKEGAVGTEKTFGQCPSSLPGRVLQSPDRINRALGPQIGVPANQLAKPKDKKRDKDGKERPKDKDEKDRDEKEAGPFVRQVPLAPRDDDTPHADPLPHSASAEEDCLDYLDEKEGWRSPRQIAADIIARWATKSDFKQEKRQLDWMASNRGECKAAIRPEEWEQLDAHWRNAFRELLGGEPDFSSRLDA